ncbi:hypothetical protein [Campylobacter sp. RM12651]|uniref:hypothetical protein n=1 Tax=Campylobacter sp. RM12651 TaxID=1660079 RepID=UPI001EFA94B4|nr:hypothetical protein [Campylobacter sp. RM12651]ULO04540.1 putative membrane protein [Campylobacter sp. RM12651]
MGIIGDIKLVWENGFFLSVILFFIFSIIAIFFLVLAISDIAKRKTDGIFANICMFFLLLILFSHLNININANGIREEALKKQEAIEEQKRENHINKMCFMLDTGAKSDFKKDDFVKKTMRDLSAYGSRIYWNLTNIQKDYYEKNKTSNGFSDNKDFSKIYSIGYQNLLKIKEEIDNRRLYCFKNYCNDIYYNKSDDDIEVKLQDFIKLKCNKGDKNV